MTGILVNGIDFITTGAHRAIGFQLHDTAQMVERNAVKAG